MDKKHNLAELGGELNALLVASRAVMSASAACFHHDLQPAAFQLAVALLTHGPSKAGQLAEVLDMDKSAISRLGKCLCEVGFAQSRVDPDDRRSVVYEISETGRTRIKASNAVKADEFFSRLEGWSDAEIVQFVALLRKFNRS